jgi:tRNA threonylcarbamoyl adenosine modification protein (Sua5/YciO/YrdC/YwlC family)
MRIDIHPRNPEPRKIAQVADLLRKGGIAVIPTDTIYAFVCDLHQYRGFEKICRLKDVRPDKAQFSLLCADLGNISAYTKPFDRSTYKLLNKALPGPYTFILEAGSEVPSLFRSRRKTIGLRVPDHPIVSALIAELGNPLVATSLHDDDELLQYPTDPDEISERWQLLVDVVVAGGAGHLVPSTVIDCSGELPVLIREGAGDSEILS